MNFIAAQVNGTGRKLCRSPSARVRVEVEARLRIIKLCIGSGRDVKVCKLQNCVYLGLPAPVMATSNCGDP